MSTWADAKPLTATRWSAKPLGRCSALAAWALCFVAVTMFTEGANAAEDKRRTTKAQKPRAPATAKPSSAAPQRTSQEQLTTLRALINDFDYDQALVLGKALLARGEFDGADLSEAQYLTATAAAITGDPAAAEATFAALLERNERFVLPTEVEPKIETPFRAAEARVARARTAAADERRAKLVASIKIEGGLTGGEQAVGGRVLPFNFQLIDPTSTAKGLDLNFRREGNDAYASVPLQATGSGSWSGAIPGDWTESKSDYSLEYYVQSHAADGALLAASGNPTSPFRLRVAGGSVQRARPFYRSPWFWGATAVGVVAAGVATFIVIHNAQAIPNTDLGTVDLQ